MSLGNAEFIASGGDFKGMRAEFNSHVELSSQRRFKQIGKAGSLPPDGLQHFVQPNWWVPCIKDLLNHNLDHDSAMIAKLHRKEVIRV